MVNVATLTANLKADTRNFERGVKGARKDLQNLDRTTQGATKQTSRLDKQIGNTGFTMRQGLAAGAGVAAVAVGKFVKDSVSAASDLQESMNAVEKVFGPVADEIHALGETSASEFGMAQSSFNQFAVRFSAFADKIADDSGRKVVDIVDEMATRVADFASVHDLSLEESQRVAQSTLAGETEVFRRFGGDVSAAAVEAKALEEGLVETGEAMDEQTKIMARYMLFMEQTENTAGDFKDTQEDLANATRSFEAEMTEAQAEIGEALLPVMAELVNVGRDLIPMFTNVATELVTVTEQAAPLIDALMFVNDLMGDNADGAEEAGESQSLLGTAFQSVMDFANPLGAIYREVTGAMEDNAEASMEAASELTDQEQAARDAFAANKELSGGFSTLGGEMNQIEEATERIIKGSADTDRSMSDLTNTVDRTREAFRLEEDQAGRVAHLLQEDLVPSTKNADRASRDLADEQGNLEFSTRRVEGAMRSLHDELRAQTDPLFALERASRQAAEAQDAVTTAREKFGEGSEEHLQAIQDAATANMDLKGAAIDVRDATDLSREAFIEQQVQMGLAREDAILLADQFEALDDFSFSPKRIRVIADMSARDRALFGSSNLTVSGRQHGGPFLAHQPLVVGERGPELVSFDRPGMVDSEVETSERATSPNQITVEQHFHRVEGERVDTDAARGLILSGLGRFIETGF